MRWSEAFIPTLRDDPADAEAASHKLLVRAGFVRPLMSGTYSLLPLGQRVCRKIERIVREEMDAIGAQEFLLPVLHPGEIWKRTGRWDAYGDELFRLRDRRDTDLCLSPTHEEIFAVLARELRSYRQLPQIWYQFQTKFRDEPRPKAGLLRTREFLMKDSYSFDLDAQGLDLSFRKHFEAYRKIFGRLGLDAIAVEASSGAMGGSESVEFMVPSAAGEDTVASCAKCGYAANTERATSTLPALEDPPGPARPEPFPTPGLRSIEALARAEGGAPPERQIKTLVYVVNDAPVLVLLRGDHTLVETKLADTTGAATLRPAREDEIRGLLGASAGSLGAVGVRGLRVIADQALRGRRSMLTGANRDDEHLRGVDVERDLPVDAWADLRAVRDGEACPLCGDALRVATSIEIGHIFKLGTRYTESLGAEVQDEAGQSRPIVMGSYGIGITRNMAALVELWHDEAGITWPVAVAPYELVITVVNPKDVASEEAAGQLQSALRAAGIEVILDDRDERAGVKFKDADLVGIPYRITVGPKGLAEGKVELMRRRDRRMQLVELVKAAEIAANAVLEERR
ncbi:MAG TPA: proline--tRNA ligase [Myxococcota bacterium]|nr:proline--tRNA ligase [Myxococcota bacterium]